MGIRAGEKRTRNWGTIIYPPSEQAEGDRTECPEDWVEILEQMGVKCAVSPCHDKDVNKDGSKKKAHRHVLFAFEGVKSEGQVRELCRKIGGVGCEPINSMSAQVRYLTHKDNPEKAQYSTLDVLTFGGFEYKRYVSTKEDEEKETLGNMSQIFNICAEHNIYDFGTLADFLMTEEPKLFTTMRKNSYFMATYLKSKQNFMNEALTSEYEKCIIESTQGSLHNLHYETASENTEEKAGNNEIQLPNLD